ncbi:PorP/SprF family type IX secretion system membrane protein [Lewinella sp. IMCC34191]|uniref:PorP/SprF family type IX secretion system membrane protein n=1 Tax=Lewinella sp. IMCC34191 TaxID=2259172 RepID=UPI0013001BB7|nr:PorP/SprF family type IX secretion system membrane protein [Lewinella sp. IMCC34191]
MKRTPLPNWIIFPLLLLLVGRLQAQDPVVSDYSAITPQLNPALTGFIPGQATTRFGIVAREQWRSFLETASYRTMAASIDHRICGSRRGDYFGLGFNVLSDWQGDPTLRRVDGMFSAAFTKNLSGSYYGGTSVSVGAEVGLIQYDLDASQLTFDHQFDSPGASGERLAYYNFGFLDYGVGVAFTWLEDSRNARSITGGLSIKHLGRPATTFVDDGSPSSVASDSSAHLAMRWSPHVQATLPVSATNSISVFAMYSYQRPHNQVYLRGMLDFRRPARGGRVPSPFLSLGGGYRLTRGLSGFGSESIVASARVAAGPMRIGVNYDVNISSLHASTSGAGAIELSLTTVFGKSECLLCPSF